MTLSLSTHNSLTLSLSDTPRSSHIMLFDRVELNNTNLVFPFRKRKPEEEDSKEDVKKECVEKTDEAAASTKPEENTHSKADDMETETA